MGETYADRVATAEALARNARKEAERRAFEEIALIWRRLASGDRSTRTPKGSTLELRKPREFSMPEQPR